MATPLIVDIEKSFPSGFKLELKLSVDLDQEPIQILFGPSGSGKSTFLRLLAGLEKPVRGLIRFGSECWLDSEKSIFSSPQKRKLSYVPQKPSLFPHLSVLGNVLYGLGDLPQAEAMKRAMELLELLEIQSLQSRLPKEISGGQQQRASLARALSIQPEFILLDEPFSAVDQPLKHLLRLKFRELFQKLKVPALIVTHDPVEASSLGSRVHLIDQGRLLQSASAAEIFRRPNSLRSAQIMGFENFLSDGSSVQAVRADEITISKEPPGTPVAVIESIPEGALVRILLQTEKGQILTALQAHSKFPDHLPEPNDRFYAALPVHSPRFSL